MLKKCYGLIYVWVVDDDDTDADVVLILTRTTSQKNQRIFFDKNIMYNHYLSYLLYHNRTNISQSYSGKGESLAENFPTNIILISYLWLCTCSCSILEGDCRSDFIFVFICLEGREQQVRDQFELLSNTNDDMHNLVKQVLGAKESKGCWWS